MPRITKHAVARALANGTLTRNDLLEVLDGRIPTRPKGRKRIHFLTKAKRDFLIFVTFEHLVKKGKVSRTAAKERTRLECGVSVSEVGRVLADQKKDIGELIPDEDPE